MAAPQVASDFINLAFGGKDAKLKFPTIQARWLSTRVHTIIHCTSTSRDIGAIPGILLCLGRNIVLLTRCARVEADYGQYRLGHVTCQRRG